MTNHETTSRCINPKCSAVRSGSAAESCPECGAKGRHLTSVVTEDITIEEMVGGYTDILKLVKESNQKALYIGMVFSVISWTVIEFLDLESLFSLGATLIAFAVSFCVVPPHEIQKHFVRREIGGK